MPPAAGWRTTTSCPRQAARRSRSGRSPLLRTPPPAHLQTRIAATFPVSAWDGHYSGLVWSVKWAQNGLSPVRPQVVMLADVTIKPGHSLLLN